MSNYLEKVKGTLCTLASSMNFSGAPQKLTRTSTVRLPLWQSKLSTKDQMLFAKRLSFLINAGVPILEGLHMMRDQTRSRSSIRMYDQLIVDSMNGQFLHKSLGRFRGAFGDFAINIIRIGEMSGGLAKNLVYLAEEMKKRHALKRKVVGALMYPIIITVGTLGITILLTTYIFPKIMPIFMGLRVELPLSTRILLATSNFLQVYGLWLLGGIGTVSVGMVIATRVYEPLRFAIHRTILFTPLLGGIVRTYNLANFCRTLGTLLQSGIVLSDGVAVTGDTTQNLVYKRTYALLAERVRKGGSTSSVLGEHKRLFPPMMTHLIAIGERTGTLSDTLVYLSDMYESELDDLTKNLSSAMEPILMIIMGTVVGFVAISIITPIYEITQTLQR